MPLSSLDVHVTCWATGLLSMWSMIRTHTKASNDNWHIWGPSAGTLGVSSHLIVPTHLRGWDSKTLFTHENTEALCLRPLCYFTQLEEWKAWVLD